jgi:hypothetical protein
MADVIVLAKDTTEVTVGQENGPRAVITDQWRLFAEMGKGAGDHQFEASATIPDLLILTVDPAFSRTEPTLLKKVLENLDSLAEFTLLEKRNVGWCESHFGKPLNLSVG